MLALEKDVHCQCGQPLSNIITTIRCDGEGVGEGVVVRV